MNVTHRPQPTKLAQIPGISKTTNLDLVYSKERSLMFILHRESNYIHAFKIEDDTSDASVLFVANGSDLKANSTVMPSANFVHCNSVLFKQAEQLPLVRVLPQMISPQFRRLIDEDTFRSLLADLVAEDEHPTAYVYGTLSKDETCLVIGTDKGTILVFNLFCLNNEPISLYYSRQLGIPVKSIELFGSNVFINNENREVTTLNFKPLECTTVLRRVDLKSNKHIVVKQIPDTQLTKIDIPNKLKRIIPVIYLGESAHPYPEIHEVYRSIIGLSLDNNLLVLFDQASLTTIFEHQFTENLPIGLYFDQKSEFLNILYDNGDIDVFNVNIGNIVMLIRFRNLMAERYSLGESWPEDVVYQTKIFASHCFTYERSTTMATQFLNLVDMLRDYKNTFVNLHSFSSFVGNPLINVTQNGSVFEFATQFYTNELIATHVEYQKLKKGAITSRPTNLAIDEFKKKDPKENKEAKKATIEEAFHNITSLKDLNMLMEQQSKEEKEQTEEKTDTIAIENIPVKLQNILERNQFALVKERLMDHPLQLLDLYEKKGVLVEEGSKLTMKDVLRIFTDLNYANFEVFADPQTKEDCVIIKKSWNKRHFFILNFYPPVYEVGNGNHNMLISTVLFPSGIDSPAETEFKVAFGDGFPTIEFAVGTQGVSESFSFVLNDRFVYIMNDLELDGSPKERQTQTAHLTEASFFSVSNYVTTSMLLGVVAELIYILKKGYGRVQPLINAIRTMYFEKMVNEIPGFCSVSQKILTLLTLNDKLLVSASSHFILNNIYDKKKSQVPGSSEQNGEFIDKRVVGPLSFYWLQVKNFKGYHEQEPLSILGVISKFELFVISMMLYHLKLGGLENTSIPLTREQVISLIHPIIE